MQDLVTPKQVAKAIGVSESSLKRWCDRGLMASVRTAGGHRRIQVAEVLRYLRENGQDLMVPELLGLPPMTAGAGPRSLEKARERLVDALVRGDEIAAWRIGYDACQSGRRMSEIADGLLAPAFHEIGRRWGCGEVALYQERRSCEIAMRIIQELRRTIEPPHPSSLRAIGGTLPGDPYALPTALVELTLRDIGWNAMSLGTGLPVDTLLQAAVELKPRLLWVSVSSAPDQKQVRADLDRLRLKLSRRCLMAIGGQECPSRLDQTGLVRLQSMGSLEQLLHKPEVHGATKATKGPLR